MSLVLAHLAALVPLADPAPGGGGSFFNSDNVRGLLLLVAGFVIIVVGIGMAGKSNKGDLKKQANSFGSVILAVIVIAMGATMAFVGFGGGILSWLGVG